MKIQRLVFPDKGRCEVEEFELDERLAPGELLLKARASLVSAGTELAMFTRSHRGFDDPENKYAKFPFRPGYAAVSDVIASTGHIPSGSRVFTWSPHATFSKMKAAEAVLVPDELADDRAVFHSLCSISLTSPRLAPARLGEQIVVIGMGIVGNLAAQLYMASGARLVAGADLAEARLAKARACGIPKTFCVGQKPLKQWVKDELGERGAELVVEAIGSSRAIDDALKCVSDRGVVVLLGSPRTKMEIDPYYDIHVKGIALIGAHGRNVDEAQRKRDNPMLMEWLRSGRVQVEPLITQRMHFSEALKAYEGLRDRTDEYLGVLLTY